MLTNLRVGVRLGLAFGTLLAMMLAIALIAWFALGQSTLRIDNLANRDLGRLSAAASMEVAQLTQSVAIRDFVSDADVAAQKRARERLTRGQQTYADSAQWLGELAKQTSNAELTALADKLRATQDKVAQQIGIAIDMVDNAQYEEARQHVFRTVGPLQTQITEELRALAAASHAQAERTANNARDASRGAAAYMISAILAALLLGAAATWWLTHSITRPLNAAVAATERIAAGDLTGDIPPGSGDETGRVLAALAHMKANLHEVAARIRSGAESISRASNEIASGNDDLSHRTEEQTSSLEETVANVEELTATVRQNSDNSKRASELALRAAGAAEQGGKIVGQVVEAMNGMHATSGRMADIVGVIDGIAFQTNLLALNAAVEAARAGEQGKGFAVVATEVRALAQRSAEAAKEIRGLIGGSIDRVRAGAQLADQAGTAIGEIVLTATEVSNVVAEISSASAEQRTGIEQIGQAITHMDDITQRNAAMVEETAAATGALRDQAAGLLETVGSFRLDQAAQAPAAPERVPAPAPQRQPARLAPRAGDLLPLAAR
ncbi:MAG: methyl-accepting chemotaxis protein [Betaproteobacteria bacterium]|nr:methyl-accepting chemotaxis protein [Betaproteobacteria bacterium]